MSPTGRPIDINSDEPQKIVTAFRTLDEPFPLVLAGGERIDTDVVEWKLKPGIVNTMSAQARYTDPSTRSFTGGATVLGISSLIVAVAIGVLAWLARDRTPRVSAHESPTD